jgi:hypothetical protein
LAPCLFVTHDTVYSQNNAFFFSAMLELTPWVGLYTTSSYTYT